MASVSGTGKKVYIPIPDDGIQCASYYNVQWRFHGTTVWNTLSPAPQSPLPTATNPLNSPAGIQPIIILPLLAEGQEYDLQIQRFCCDGSNSTIASTTFTI